MLPSPRCLQPLRRFDGKLGFARTSMVYIPIGSSRQPLRGNSNCNLPFPADSLQVPNVQSGDRRSLHWNAPTSDCSG